MNVLKKYVIQESGSVTLPAEFRKKYGLRPGDEISFIETEEGLLISARETLIDKLLNELGDDLRSKDVVLEDLIASGREQRAKLLKDHFGIDLDE
jgi:AbrB family looped-hinge helix DNA binding protein